MKTRKLSDILLVENKKIKMMIHILVSILLSLGTLAVYLTGGIPSAFSHTMYIPILIAAICCGPWMALAVGIIAGFLVGPLMSFSFMPGAGEPLINSGYRTLFFVIVGLLAGFVVEHAKYRFKKVKYDFYHDPKTGLPNMNLYIQDTKDLKFQKMVLVAFNIHNFEDLNALLGLDEYTKLVTEVYYIIKDFFPSDTKITYVNERRIRIELAQDNYEKQIEALLKHIDERSFMSANIPLFIDYTFGISLADPKKDIWTRIREGIVAALHAKNQNVKYTVYNISCEEDQTTMKTLGELPKAIKNNGLFLVYQPFIDLHTKKCIGIEALIRWQTLDKIIYPMDFIPYAEKTRLINLITEWVFTQAAKDYNYLISKGIDINLAINVSQRDLHEISFVEKLINIIKEAKIDPKKIEIEVTESSLMLNKQVANNCLLLLQKEGFATILDDFGNRYSSLSYLRDLPVEKIKVDRNYIKNLLIDESQKILIQVILNLAHSLNFKVMIEGIEDEESLALLKEMGANYGQGYLFAKPKKIEDFIEWYKAFGG